MTDFFPSMNNFPPEWEKMKKEDALQLLSEAQMIEELYYFGRGISSSSNEPYIPSVPSPPVDIAEGLTEYIPFLQKKEENEKWVETETESDIEFFDVPDTFEQSTIPTINQKNDVFELTRHYDGSSFELKIIQMASDCDMNIFCEKQKMNLIPLVFGDYKIYEQLEAMETADIHRELDGIVFKLQKRCIPLENGLVNVQWRLHHHDIHHLDVGKIVFCDFFCFG